MRQILVASAAVALFLFTSDQARSDNEKPVIVGSKNFTESRVLAEMMAQLIEAQTEIPVERKIGLGGTLICFTALKSGEIDLYPDYTGTGWALVLKEKGKITDPLRAFLHVQREYRERFRIEWLEPFGLNNSYAIAMNEAKAQALGVSRISDLALHAKSLKAGVSLEFLNREDGYPGLSKAYGFELGEVRGMEHGLAYEAINAEEIDIVDAYTTDGKLLRYPLRILSDDRRFFPPYNAAPIVRMDTLERYPELRPLLNRLAFLLPDARMQQLNYQVEAEGKSFSAVAHAFLVEEKLITKDLLKKRKTVARDRQTFWGLMHDRADVTLELLVQHILLTVVSVLLAALFAVPLGIFITRRTRARQVALGTAGVIQTIPSLALLAFMIPIPWLGLGVDSAIAALFLYAILPILRNTYTGIVEVDPQLIEAAQGIGLTDRQILFHVQLPLAVRTIMAGIRTSTVISIGVATLAAFIGAGGLGEPIVTGLQLNDTNMILTGAVPAALLALIADLGLGRLELFVAPRGLSAGG